MKNLKVLLLVAFAPLLGSCCWTCHDDGPPSPSQNYNPVTMTREQLEASIELTPPKPMVKSGKIYVKGDLLFVSDVNKGFHIYRYDTAADPTEIAFLSVPGATDLAVRNNALYINQATDLVTLAYENNTVLVVKRNRNVFPQKPAPDASWGSFNEEEIVIDWIPI